MKYIISALLIVAISFGAQAQSTSPRYVAYGTTDASSISFGQALLTDVASSTIDTVKLYPRHQQINIGLTVLDSCVLKLQSLAGCYQNDHMFLYITNPAQSGVMKLNGNFIVSTGTSTISLTANKHCVFEWWFDGINWVEVSRNLNY
jgi:hypothetical protein